jgi:glutamine synthetase type III
LVEAKDACEAADRLNDLFDVISLIDGLTEARIKRFKAAVDGGERLEVVMARLLAAVGKVAVLAPGGTEYAGELAEALDEVKALPASLEEDEGAAKY